MKAHIITLYILIAVALAGHVLSFAHFKEEIRLTDAWVGILHQAVETLAVDYKSSNSF